MWLIIRDLNSAIPLAQELWLVSSPLLCLPVRLTMNHYGVNPSFDVGM